MRKLLRGLRWLSAGVTFGLFLAGLAYVVSRDDSVGPGPTGEAALPKLTLSKTQFKSLRGWDADDHAAALAAFRRSCDGLIRRDWPAAAEVALDGSAWEAVCRAAQDASDARTYFETWFEPFRVRVQGQDGFLTGYYEPSLRGRETSDARYATPLHGMPDDLIVVDLGTFHEDFDGRRITGRLAEGTLKPYFSRAEILDGAAAAPVLAYVDNPVDAFFLHIQGSGRVEYPDGSMRRFGYAGQNGRSYVPIGRVLADRGAIARERVTMQSIRAWLSENPAAADAIMNENPSYIFFQPIEVDDPALGPIGAAGVPLTPERSLAVDRRYYPLGAPVWLDGEAPGERTGEAEPFRKLMIAQDTGGAIKGGLRGDVFWGFGDRAGDIAGRMKHAGDWVILLPHGAVP